ncbi:hypothetical protein [Variovorax paradoxus]|uniref:hypothetical protein n=1 Tax=Variovorax paradoxus TaxID=34073 RepID=UPI003D64BC7B
MTWIITSTGREYHLSGPGALGAEARVFDIEDIAHHLSLINRFMGATSRPYSVAEHSLLCCDIAARAGASPVLQLAALMHDAHKAYVSELSSPAKIAVDGYGMAGGGVAAWQLFEAEHAKALRASFGLLTVFASHRGFLRNVNLQALAAERRDLTAYDAGRHAPWPMLDGASDAVEAPGWVRLNTARREATTWREWRGAFLLRHSALKAAARERLREALAC